MNSNIVPFQPRSMSANVSGPASTRTGHAAGQRADTCAVYSVREVARLLSLSLGSTYSLVRCGEIPAIKLGGRWVIPRKRFHAWLDSLPEASVEDFDREMARLERGGRR